MFQLKKEPYLELWVSIIINRFWKKKNPSEVGKA